MENKVIVGSELDKEKERLIDHIRRFKSAVEKKELSLVTNNSVSPMGWMDGFRLFLDGWEDSSSPIKNLLLSSAYTINRSCPLVLPLYFGALTGEITSEPKRPTRVSSGDIADKFRSANDEFIQKNLDILMRSLEVAGATGCVTIDSHYKDDPSIEVFDGFRTLCRVNPFFKEALKTTEIKNAVLVVVSGAIIEVSEIHHILQNSYDSKTNFIIVANSFSDDVSNTLLVNWQNKKTTVYPFVLQDEIQNINEVKDICDVAGVIPVSRETGLINTIDIESQERNDFFYDCDTSSLRILISPSSAQRLINARNRLQEKLEKENVLDVKDIIRKRISKMSARNVTIKMKFSETERGLIQDRALAFFSYFSKCAQQGVVQIEGEKTQSYFPSLEALRAIRAGMYDRKSLRNIKAVLRIEK